MHLCVIDLNRGPDNEVLYSGRGTGLIPLDDFSGQPLYPAERVPEAAEQNHRLTEYWQPYHDVLAREMERIKRDHGFVVMLDAHSIAARVPGLFEGKLPDLNLGSYDQCSADPGLIAQLDAFLRNSGFSSVLDGRFKGGYITRHYGQPENNTHVVQLELSQDTYLLPGSASGAVLDQDKYAKLQPVLLGLVRCLLDWKPALIT